jgi:hypothetical protein
MLVLSSVLLLTGCGSEGGAIEACSDYLGMDDYDVEESTATSTGDDAWDIEMYYERDGSFGSGGYAGSCQVTLDDGYFEVSF